MKVIEWTDKAINYCKKYENIEGNIDLEKYIEENLNEVFDILSKEKRILLKDKRTAFEKTKGQIVLVKQQGNNNVDHILLKIPEILNEKQRDSFSKTGFSGTGINTFFSGGGHYNFSRIGVPELRGDSKIINILRDLGCKLELIGRSGFSARNSYKFVSVPDSEIDKKIIIIETGGDNDFSDEKETYISKGNIEDQSIRTTNIYNNEVHVNNVVDILLQRKMIEKANNILDEQNGVKISKKIFDTSNDGGITGVFEIGGKEEFDIHLPKRFKILASKKTKNTEDSRQNRTHTYESIILDTEKIGDRKVISISIPDEYKGMVIGKGGKNIKKLSKDLRCFIKII